MTTVVQCDQCAAAITGAPWSLHYAELTGWDFCSVDCLVHWGVANAAELAKTLAVNTIFQTWETR